MVQYLDRRGARHVSENWSGMTNVKGDEEKAMGNDSEAVQKFLDGNVCSQAVLGHYCERFNLDRSTALKIAAGFGAGMQMGKPVELLPVPIWSLG